MRNYQKTKNNPYLLPKFLYAEVKYMIKDYKRLKEDYEMLSAMSSENRNWAKLCTEASKISAIDMALLRIPEEYRLGVVNNIEHERSRDGYYPADADYRTYQKYKQRFIYYVAENLNYV